LIIPAHREIFEDDRLGARPQLVIAWQSDMLPGDFLQTVTQHWPIDLLEDVSADFADELGCPRI
jgi:hypothetical protein